MARYWPIIAFGLLIDALQAAFALIFTVLQFATPVGGGISGAFAGCYLNAVAWYDIAGCLKGAVIGGAALASASFFAVPIGAVIDVALTVTLGGALIAALAFMGMFYPGIIIGSFIGETIPLLDAIIPGWTYMALQCARRKAAGERAAEASEATRTQALSQAVSTRERLWEDIRNRGSEESYVEQAA